MSILDERPPEIPPEDHTKFKLIVVADTEEGRKDPAKGFGFKIPMDGRITKFFKRLKFWKKD